MDLLLSVVSDPDGANMLKHTRLFTREGGSIGRADSNDWVLPDPHRVVSSRHAEIRFADNRYFLIDQSTNGTFHNQSPDPVGKGNRIPLAEGDLVCLGDYQLKVTVREAAADTGIPEGLGGADFLDHADRTTFSPEAAAKMQSAREARELDSWLEPGTGSQSNHSGEWGYLVAPGSGHQDAGALDNLLGTEVPTDPLQALDRRHGDDMLDPVSALGASSGSASHWGADDAWWKDGSEQDHAPAHSHAMQVSAAQDVPPVPTPATNPAHTGVAGQTVECPEPPPVSPGIAQAPLGNAPASAPVQSSPDNPFAESFSAVADHRVEGAPGFAAMESTGHAAPQGTPPTGRAFAGGSQNFTPPAVNPGVQPAPSYPPQSQQPPRSTPAQHPQPTGTAVDSVGVAPALAQQLGLNLSPDQLTQLDQQTAAIVEESVSRLIDLLRARTSIKNELRVQRTMIQTEANNPLKFSATARDALGAMFAGTGAFMTPVEAVRDSFDDLSDHQVAVLSGMRAGYEAMLRFFNPENIARRGGTQSGVFASKSARNWENFVESYREMLSDPDTCYRRLFGEEFASTYESQLAELKNARNLNKSNH